MAFLDPQTYTILRVVKVTRFETGRDFRTHPRFGVEVSDGGSVGHPSDDGLRIFDDRLRPGAVVDLESDADWVRVFERGSDVVLVERRWASLLDGSVPGLDETVRTVPAGTQATRTFPVAADGRLDTRARPLVGGWYAGKQVGALDHDNGTATLFDPASRVVLAELARTDLDPPAAVTRTRYHPFAGPGQYSINHDMRTTYVSFDAARFFIAKRHRGGTEEVNLSVGVDGWFVMTHPKTGARIISGWRSDASGARAGDRVGRR